MNSKTLKRLPPFEPVTDADLRRCWSACSPEDAQRLSLEVVRYRHLLAEIDHLYEGLHQSWRDTVGGELGALVELRRLMLRERRRVPFTRTAVLDPAFEPDRNRLR